MFSSELYRDESLGCDCHEDEDSRCDCWEPSAGRFEATTVAVVWTHIQTGGFLSVYFTLLSHLQLKAMKKVKPCRQEGHINVSIERSKLVSGRMEVPSLPHLPLYAPSRPEPRRHLLTSHGTLPPGFLLCSSVFFDFQIWSVFIFFSER